MNAFVSLLISSALASPLAYVVDATRPWTPETKICVVADTGSADAEASKVVKALEMEKCDQLWMVGDMVLPGIRSVDDRELKRGLLDPYKAIIDSKRTAVYLILGNHEYQRSVTAWLKVPERYPSFIFPNPYYLQRLSNGACMLALDSTPFTKKIASKSVYVEEAWFATLAKTLKTECRFVAVLAHHPYRSTGLYGEAVGRLKTFYQSHVVGHVDLLVSGHYHLLSDEGVWNGTRLLVVGGGGQTIRPSLGAPLGAYVNMSHGYLVLRFKEEGKALQAEYTFKSVGSDGVVRIDKTDTVMGQGFR